jgi:hypothetical protein
MVDPGYVQLARRGLVRGGEHVAQPAVADIRRDVDAEGLGEPVDLVGQVETEESRMAADAGAERGEQPLGRGDGRRVGEEVRHRSGAVVDQPRWHEQEAADRAVQHGHLDVELAFAGEVEQFADPLDLLGAYECGIRLQVRPHCHDPDVVHAQRADVGEVGSDRVGVPVRPAVPPALARRVVQPEAHLALSVLGFGRCRYGACHAEQGGGSGAAEEAATVKS